jgi:hypothetical protein
MTKSHDIVDRLRLFGSSAFEREAANEIERLRTQLEMWQDGNIMAESHSEEIERLREQLRLASIDNFNTTAELDQVRVERDEARRDVCYLRPCVCLGLKTADEYAQFRGWDCFKEPAHAS